MFTLVGFSQSVDQAALAAITALQDPHIRVSGNDVIVPTGMNNIVGYSAFGPNITRAQLVSPSQRRFINHEIIPLDRTASPTTPTLFQFRGENPIPLDENEALNAQTSEDGAGATRQNVLVWLADGPIAAVTGDIRTVRVTGSTTLVASAWTNAALTFDQSLPAGVYSIVGARFRSTGLQAYRLVFVGQQWRPGGLGAQAVTDNLLGHFRHGIFGEWGQFAHNTPPTVDFLSVSADTSEVGELDLIKVS